jgi:hypothetical protein
VRRALLAAVLVAGSASPHAPARAQVSLTPQTIQLATITCRELLSLPGQRRDLYLLYFNGYFDGRRGATTWDERLTGERVDRVVSECKSSPDKPLLRAFADAWSH